MPPRHSPNMGNEDGVGLDTSVMAARKSASPLRASPPLLVGNDVSHITPTASSSTLVQSGGDGEGVWAGELPAEISRTPSQSTTATTKSHNSLETAASSMQSELVALDATRKRSEGEETQDSIMPAIPALAGLTSSEQITVCSSPDGVGPDRFEADLLRRYHALHELVDTEQNYAEDLSILDTIYFANMEQQTFFEENDDRIHRVRRNTAKLFDLHTRLAGMWAAVLREQKVGIEDEGSIATKAAQCGESIRLIVDCLTEFSALFGQYQYFCSRHAEAMVVIREAERRHNGEEFAAYERSCANLIRTQLRQPSSQASSRRSSSAGFATPVAASTMLSITPLVPLDKADAQCAGFATPSTSGSTTPSGSLASLPAKSSTRSSGRLIFADYLIKPIQRLCLYPLVLSSLLRYTPPHEMQTRASLQGAIESMRMIADDVDRASRTRERELMAELTLSRIEPNDALSTAFLKSLGAPQLSGTLDVLYHHSVLAPLSAPLRFQHLGVIMWSDFLLLVRIRKNRQLECRHWLPLGRVKVTPADTFVEGQLLTDIADTTLATTELAGRPILPFSFRITCNDTHHFEVSASHGREFQTWHDALRLAASSVVDTAKVADASRSYPCSVGEESGSASGGAALSEYITLNIKQPLASSLDNLIKLPSVSTRSSTDRTMIFSDLLIAPAGIVGLPTTMVGGSSALKDISEALIAQQLRQTSTPSIGSAVGAAMGLAKMAATQMPTVKRARRASSFAPLDALSSPTALSPTLSVNEAGVLLQRPQQASEGTNKRSSLSSLRLNTNFVRRSMTLNANTADANAMDGLVVAADVNRRLSSPITDSFSSRVKGTLKRANSRLARAPRSGSGSLPATPMSSTLDLIQPLSPAHSHTDDAWQNQTRRRSETLRGVWSAGMSAARRHRSQSAQAVFTMGPTYEGLTTTLVQSPAEVMRSPGGSEISVTTASTLPVEDEAERTVHRPRSTDLFRWYSNRTIQSAPSSRRQSVASIFSFQQQEQPDAMAQPPPVRSSEQRGQERAASTRFRQARSFARSRVGSSAKGSGGAGIPVTTAPGMAVQPLASQETALGCMFNGHHAGQAFDDGGGVNLAPPYLRMHAERGSPGAAAPDDGPEKRLRRSNSIADKLRGSLAIWNGGAFKKADPGTLRRSQTSVGPRVADAYPSAQRRESEEDRLAANLLGLNILDDVDFALSPPTLPRVDEAPSTAEQSYDSEAIRPASVPSTTTTK